MKAIFLTAVIGLIASVIVHVSTFFGVNMLRVFPPVLALHILIFVVWIPLFLPFLKKRVKENSKDMLKILIRGASAWMVAMTLVFMLYAVFNLVFTMEVLNEGGIPEELNGRKVIQNHGKVIRQLTDEEYERHKDYSLRAMSGRWMLFYAAGMTAAYSRRKQSSDEPQAIC